MPIYEYNCKNCDITYERIEKMDAPRSVDCESCGGLAERIISTSYKVVKTRETSRRSGTELSGSTGKYS